MNELEGRRDGAADLGGFFAVVAAAVVVASVALLTWAATVWWLRRYGYSRWWPAAVAGVGGLVVVVVGVAQGTPARLLAAVAAVEISTFTVGPVLSAGGLLLGRVALATAPVAIPAGLAAAALTPTPDEGLPGSPSRALRRRDARRAEREIGRVERRAEKPAQPKQPAQVLGVLAGQGDLAPDWTQGKYLVLPKRAAGLPRLVVGRPGQGKSVYLCREVHLAGLDHRQTVVIDCKGEPGFADEVEAAYRAGWDVAQQGDAQRAPTVHRWPDEPLNGWTGGPAAVANRLLSVWTFDLASLWYREVVDAALTLALHAPGPEVACSRDVLRRVRPGVLTELWRENEDELALARSLESKDKLDDVGIRLGNLLGALGGLLDGDQAIGQADLTILSLPTMGKEHQAAAVLRVVMADLAHYVSSRKAPGRPLLVVVDEFSAVPGGREHAVHLTERGRSAGAATVLAVQSARGLGDDDDADRLIGAVGMVALFGTAEPERILKLAGTVTATRHSTTTGTSTTDTYSEQTEYRVDANDVRALPPGYAYILSAGRAQRIKVIRPPAGDRPCPPGPGDAVTAREVPAPPAPRQGPPAPTGRPAGVLDPPPAPRVRRHRPPPVGGAGGASPNDDRDNQEEP